VTQKTMTIGTTLKGEPFRLPTDTVTSTLVTFGGKGMGKTNLGSVIVEELTRMRRKEPGMATDPQRGRAGFAERRSVGQLYSRANS